MLQKLVARLRNGVLSTDPIIRMGGEEFLILLNDCNADGARATAKRLARIIGDAPFRLMDNEIAVTVSFGIATPFATDTSYKNALMRSDTALYAAKNAGRNRVFEFDTDGTKEAT